MAGADVKGGFVNFNATPGLVGVQCEACHGPGLEHAQTKSEDYGFAGGKSCLPCHTKDQSPGYTFAEYWLKIKH